MKLSECTSIYLPKFEKYLRGFVTSFRDQFSPGLFEMIYYHMGWNGETENQGKRIRPLLVLLCTAVTNTDYQKALPAACAVELLHNFSLVHDDVQDQSPLRRGKPTIWKKWGSAQAINTGDALFSLAQLAMLNLELDNPLGTIRCTKLLNQTCLQLTSGQYLDLSYESRTSIEMDDYWQMIEGKTAALLSTCTQLGAIIGQTSSDIEHEFTEFGKFLGLAFQVQDDLLGIWGNSLLTGKSTDSDLVSGKKSLPVLFGLSRKGPFAKRWQEGPIHPTEVSDIAHQLESEGSLTYTQMIADQMTRKAVDHLDKIPSDKPEYQALIELVQLLLNRNI